MIIVIDSKAAGSSASGEIYLTHGESLVSTGLAGVETVTLQTNVNGTLEPLKDDAGASIVLDATDSQVTMVGSANVTVSCGATAGAVSVVAYKKYNS